MKAQIGILLEENKEPNWWFQGLNEGWQKAASIADGVWWFVMEAKMVREIAPGVQPEIIDPAERYQHVRGLGPWV